VVILKGSGTLVCYERNNKQYVGVCEAGNPGMATGGMGDVLTGIVASFVSQGLKPYEAAEMAVDVHAKAADLASLDVGEVGLLPSDVLEELRYLLQDSE
jgi:NAD(P)H-hydrate repair Nnr-like enzyme with NAD(P)H-hydrate dehydratase domain